MGGRRAALAAAELARLTDGRVHRDVVMATAQRHQITGRQARCTVSQSGRLEGTWAVRNPVRALDARGWLCGVES